MCFPFVVPEGEEIEAHLEFVFDGVDLVVGDSVGDLIQTLFGEEAIVPEWALMICGARVIGRQHSVSKTSILSVLDIDDCPLLGDEGGQLPELKTRQR